MFHRHLIEQDGEDTFLHLASIFRTEDDHFFVGKVDGDTGRTSHTSSISVGREGAGIVDYIIGVEVLEF